MCLLKEGQSALRYLLSDGQKQDMCLEIIIQPGDENLVREKIIYFTFREYSNQEFCGIIPFHNGVVQHPRNFGLVEWDNGLNFLCNSIFGFATILLYLASY